MGRLQKKLLCAVFCIMIAVPSFRYEVQAETEAFNDVPAGHWAYEDIMSLRKLNVTQGIGGNAFGLGRTMTRAEFVTFLAKLMGWGVRDASSGEEWYAAYIDAAVGAGAVTAVDASGFRPADPITREEIAVMLVRSLGYDNLASQLGAPPPPFEDVARNAGYIAMAKDFGIVSGLTDKTFGPGAPATREQGAAMLMRLYNKLDGVENSNGKGWANAFYAISSNNQSKLISQMDSVSFGWCRVEWRDGVYVNTTAAQNNEYNKPEGYEEILSETRALNKQALLMVSVQNKMVSAAGSSGESQPLAAYLIGSEQLRQRLVGQIAVAAADFDGVAIDFENLKGSQAKQQFTEFLKELKATLVSGRDRLYVAVQPARQAGQAYYDGYDFREIGRAADKVILMAHDYYAKNLTDQEMRDGFNVTPLTPINEVYHALKAITDPQTGVEDHDKILFQISFDAAQWKTKAGEIINKQPFSPAYGAIYERISQGASPQYSQRYESPFITFINEEEGTDNIVWYENKQSVAAKLNLSAMFGVYGVSIWRLGIIPEESIGLF